MPAAVSTPALSAVPPPLAPEPVIPVAAAQPTRVPDDVPAIISESKDTLPMPIASVANIPLPQQPAIPVPDSSVVASGREPDDQKPLVKSEPRNGLDKIETSHYIDPIERSLASLERSLKADVPMDVSVSDSSMRLEEDFSLPKPSMVPDVTHRNLMAQLGGITDVARVPDQIRTDIYLPPHNGYVEKSMQHERDLLLRPEVSTGVPGLTNVAPVASIFDPAPTVTPHPIVAQPPHNVPNTASLITPAAKKDDIKPLLTPKPIEDLMAVSNMITNNVSDRAKYEMEKKMEESKNSNFAQAFKVKQEQNLKNASSWSSLAQAGSPQSIPNMATNNQVKQKPVMDSFQVRVNKFPYFNDYIDFVWLLIFT